MGEDRKVEWSVLTLSVQKGYVQTVLKSWEKGIVELHCYSLIELCGDVDEKGKVYDRENEYEKTPDEMRAREASLHQLRWPYLLQYPNYGSEYQVPSLITTRCVDGFGSRS